VERLGVKVAADMVLRVAMAAPEEVTAVRAAKAVPAAVLVDRAARVAVSANIFARKRSASFASKRWT
jgi:hypothetical protein